MRIYLAGPLFTHSERVSNRVLANLLRLRGHEVFLPQEGEPRGDDKRVFTHDVTGLKKCEIVVACLDGADPDSGTAWEMGWAFAAGKPIVGFRTDFRAAADGRSPINIMLYHCLATYIPCPSTKNWTSEGMAQAIHDAVVLL